MRAGSMAHGGRRRPDVPFKAAARSPIPGTMEPTIVPLQRATFSLRAGRLQLGVDVLTIDHPKLHQPVEVPLSAIAKVIVGPGSEVCRKTTIPAGIDPKGATLVLVLATPVKIGLRGGLSRVYSEVAVAVADPAQAALALSRLRVEPPAPPTAEQLRDARPLRAALGLVVPTVLMFALMFGVQYGVRQIFPSSASAADKAAQRDADAEKTEGRSRLPGIPSVHGAIAFRSQAADGSLLYAWQAGRSLRIRVDTSPANCTGANWRDWWHTAEHVRVKVEADGSFRDVHRRTDPVASGGVDVLTTWVEGAIRHGVIDVRFTRQDDYRSAVGNGICQRRETFSARRSG
jgi:hypothetical protein